MQICYTEGSKPTNSLKVSILEVVLLAPRRVGGMKITVQSKHVVPYSPEIAAMLGSINAAIYFRQLDFTQHYCKTRDGWFSCSVQEIRNATYLSRFQQEAARRLLVDKGWVRAALRCRSGGTPTLHYKVIASITVV